MNAVEVEADRRAVHADGGVAIGSWIAHPSRLGPEVPVSIVTETGIAGLTLGGGLG